MKKKQIKWTYYIGQTLKDEKRDLTITDRKMIKGTDGYNHQYYKYKCNKCGFDCGEHYNVIKNTFKEECWVHVANMTKQGCACCCCNPQVIQKGINDIGTTRPDISEILSNKEDIYKYTSGSSKKVLCRCPNCGYEKAICISNLTSLGRSFPCNVCSDNIPIPEKIMINILILQEKCNKINNLKPQLSHIDKVWVGKYKYDFYFESNGEEYIVETHGMQHYEEGFGRIKSNKQYVRTLKEEQENDLDKQKLAIQNGIKSENYIIIDCRYSDLDFIKNNIIHSKLNEIFDLNNIDWDFVWSIVQKSFMVEACKLKKKNPEYTVKNISNILNIRTNMVCQYLKRGTKLGWCNYNPKEEVKKSSSKTGKITVKYAYNSCKIPIEIFKDNISLGIFESFSELERKSEKLFNVKLNYNGIKNVLLGNQRQYKGFIFKYMVS